MAKNYAKGSDQNQLSLLPKLPKPKETEVEAYAFIRHQLRDLGWIVKDPSKGGSGQVWTQNQCLADPHMKAAFGQVRPENVVKLSEKFVWVIEAKATRKELDKALAEATNFYCEKINGIKGQYKALMATGVAGKPSKLLALVQRILSWTLPVVQGAFWSPALIMFGAPVPNPSLNASSVTICSGLSKNPMWWSWLL